MTAQGWWYRASQAQKLAQLDGGIECGMTARHIAVASGVDESKKSTVKLFALYHGRKLAQHFIQPKGGSGKLQTKHRLAQYRRGEPVDFWDNTQQVDEFRLDEVDQP